MSVPGLSHIAIVVLIAWAGTNVGEVFGVRDNLCGIMFVSAWMLPVARLGLRTRLSDWAPASASPTTQPWFLILGALPWFALPWLRITFPHSVAWQSFDVPAPLRWVGIALTVAMYCAPILRRQSGPGASGSSDAITLRTYTVTAVAVVLISSNLFVAVTAVAGIVCVSRACRRGAQGVPAAAF